MLKQLMSHLYRPRRLPLLALMALLPSLAAAQDLPYRLVYRDPWPFYPSDQSNPIFGGFDVNGDGRSDLLTPVSDGPARLYLSQGNGRFVRKTLPFWVRQEQGFYQSFASGDFDGDGRTDLAYTGEAHQVRVLRNLGAGNFRHIQAIPTLADGSEPRLRVTSADFNGDGRLDLVALDRRSDGSASGMSAMLAWGQAGGSFALAQTRMPTVARAMDLLPGDFTGDGRADLLVANSAGEVSLSDYDSSTGTPRLLGIVQIHPNVTSNVTRPTGLGGGDINGDGSLDAVIAYYHVDAGTLHSYVRLLRNNGTGGVLQVLDPVLTRPNCNGFTNSVRLGDYNQDTKTDIAISCPEAGFPVALYYGHGDFTFDAPRWVEFTTPGDIGLVGRGLARGDYNGDGKLDLAILTDVGLRVMVHDATAVDRLFANGFE